MVSWNEAKILKFPKNRLLVSWKNEDFRNSEDFANRLHGSNRKINEVKMMLQDIPPGGNKKHRKPFIYGDYGGIFWRP